jgi:S1-C subfamily serine protease
LPRLWWWTDVRWRQSSVDPRLYFDARPLTDAEKRERGLRPDGFASMVKYVDSFAQMTKSHELKLGDIVVAVDGVDHDDIAPNVELYIKLRKTPGDVVQLDVIRDGKRIQMPLRTYRMSFRK